MGFWSGAIASAIYFVSVFTAFWVGAFVASPPKKTPERPEVKK